MQDFFDWINSNALLDLHLHGSKYTWSNHQLHPILSRLDRFLISRDWAILYPNATQKVLPKLALDHCPILLDSMKDRWGPTPFRFKLLWLLESDLPNLIRAWWKEFGVEGWVGYMIITKLKNLKPSIKN